MNSPEGHMSSALIRRYSTFCVLLLPLVVALPGDDEVSSLPASFGARPRSPVLVWGVCTLAKAHKLAQAYPVYGPDKDGTPADYEFDFALAAINTIRAQCNRHL